MLKKTKVTKKSTGDLRKKYFIVAVVVIILLVSLYVFLPKGRSLAWRAVGYEQNEIICVSNQKQINNQLDQLKYFIEQSKISTTASITSGYAGVIVNINALVDKGYKNYKGDGDFPSTWGKFPSNVLDADIDDVDDFEEEINDIDCDFG